MDEVFEFLDHLAAHPPEYMILAAVHGVAAPKKPAFDANAMLSLGSFMGPGRPMSSEFRSIVEWAESFGPPNHA